MGDGLPAPSNGRREELLTHDLDFFLLDLVSEAHIGLPVFDIPNLSECVNRKVPQYTRPELIAALAALFQDGDIRADARLAGGRWYRSLCLNPEEIEAGIAGAMRTSYYLTRQGGERWAQLSGVDWQRWDFDRWTTLRNGQITTASRALTKSLFEREVGAGTVRGPGQWSEVRPWKVTYWHEEPVGYQVRYRLQQVHPIEPLRSRSPQGRLSAATELTRREVSVHQLIAYLNTPCAVLRYCAAKELGERKATEAMEALLAVVINQCDVAAVEALGQIGDQQALEPLLVLFQYWRGLSTFSDPQFFAALQRTLKQLGGRDVAG